MKVYLPISKVEEKDDGTLIVAGIASTESIDVQGETVTADAMKAALPDFFKYGTGNLREMHQPQAAGTVDKASIEDGTTYIECTVVDPIAVKKVQTGVYKGFSIGGKAMKKTDGIISQLRLSEISLVDRPANPDAVITMWKADAEQEEQQPEVTPEAAVEQLAALLDKGDITPQRLIELAQAEMAKSDEQPTEQAAEAPAATADESKPAEGEDSAKADAEGDVAKGYEGEEVYDSITALRALEAVTYLLTKERAEGEDEPEQIKALKGAVASLKDFIAAEIKEDNSPEAAGETAPVAVAMADSTEDVAKAGKMISSKNMEKLQAVHDACVSMGCKCDMGKHDHADDLTKMNGERDDALAKVASIEADLKKVTDENDLLKSEIAKLKAMPAPGKALLKAISKADDAGELAGEPAQKLAPVVDAKGEVNDAASLIKMIHSKGGVIVR